MRVFSVWFRVVTVAALSCFATYGFAQTPIKIGSYTSPARSFSTNSFWLEGPSGLILIDTQFLPKEGLEAVQLAEKTTGKKVELAILLHPNPDKFNGTAALQARGIRVVTAQQVLALIPAVHEIRWGWFGREYAPDYPRDAAVPESFGDRTTTLRAGGVEVTAHVLGRGASGAHVVVQAGGHVFVGDLINPENHAWLELGLIDAWLQRLDDIARLTPERIYPGRGAAGDAALIARQAEYLRDVQRRVRAYQPAGELSSWRKFRLAREIESAYPTLGYPIFMRDGLAAVWKAEAAKQ
jgi:glyoxylase-like metal-dependent hydrolase (beta-lactamase superfamily II)